MLVLEPLVMLLCCCWLLAVAGYQTGQFAVAVPREMEVVQEEGETNLQTNITWPCLVCVSYGFWTAVCVTMAANTLTQKCHVI